MFNNASPHVALYCSDWLRNTEANGRVGYISVDREQGALETRLQVHKALDVVNRQLLAPDVIWRAGKDNKAPRRSGDTNTGSTWNVSKGANLGKCFGNTVKLLFGAVYIMTCVATVEVKMQINVTLTANIQQNVFNNASPHVALDCSDWQNGTEAYGRVGYISVDREQGASETRLQVHKALLTV